jgi:hypothetical protein
VPPRGAFHDRRERWVRDAVGAALPPRVLCAWTDGMSRTAKSCGPDAPVLASSPWKANASRGQWWHSMATRESAYKSSNHCAGKAGVFPLHLYAHVRFLLIPIAHETAGAGRTRSSLRPLFFWGANDFIKLGRNAVARMRTHVSSSPRTRGPIRRGVSYCAMRSMPSLPTTARGYGSPRSRGRRRNVGARWGTSRSGRCSDAAH